MSDFNKKCVECGRQFTAKGAWMDHQALADHYVADQREVLQEYYNRVGRDAS